MPFSESPHAATARGNRANDGRQMMRQRNDRDDMGEEHQARGSPRRENPQERRDDRNDKGEEQHARQDGEQQEKTPRRRLQHEATTRAHSRKEPPAARRPDEREALHRAEEQPPARRLRKPPARRPEERGALHRAEEQPHARWHRAPNSSASSAPLVAAVVEAPASSSPCSLPSFTSSDRRAAIESTPQ